MNGCGKYNSTNNINRAENKDISQNQIEVKIGNMGYQHNDIVLQGQYVEVPINLNSGILIGGFDLLIAYDKEALKFQSVTPGKDLTDNNWEYFTYGYDLENNCTDNCPSGLIRVTAFTSTNIDTNHPTKKKVSELAIMKFLVTNNKEYDCIKVPLKFYWLDCGDNSFYSWNQDTLFIANKIYNTFSKKQFSDKNTVQNFASTYPTYYGAQDRDCFSEDIHIPKRTVTFYNGSVQINCVDIEDSHGDLNLNEIINELSDVELFSDYFMTGLRAFIINTKSQTATSDVNHDGKTLTVADFVYLIKIINGNALPYPKLKPDTAQIKHTNGILSVDKEMGAALIVLEGNDFATLIVNNMEIMSNFDGTNTQVLIYSLDGNTFSGEFLNVNSNVVSVEFGSTEGTTVALKHLKLGANYPNPFADITTIPFYLMNQAKVTFIITTNDGQIVYTQSEYFQAGENTFTFDGSTQLEGIYRYTIIVNGFEENKSMNLTR